MKRNQLLKANTGSWNYNLQEEGSDKDYKVFVAPTFEDLYKGKMYADSIIGKKVDFDVHDIRKLPDLLWKSNIAYLELLFSDDIWFDQDYFGEFRKLLNLADGIAKINLPQLFKSAGGMFIQRMKKLNHVTEGTQHLIDAHGWNTKEGLHTFRTLNLIVRYESTEFTDFKSALKYTDEERKALLAIKNGEMTKEEFISFVTMYHDSHFAPIKDKFLSQDPNLELKEEVDNIVMEIVGSKIGEELYFKNK
ncbi:DNA polymerase beta superfamily protein [Bacillus subtilis]|uniref:DNA polymerase beta superfamily protein n=1 Tax=Bacillus subtilis TaxID=1423 RepID=UPI002DB8E57C|nr:nucleotidyltransferase domain-containing protein [Bacillus subtilis]MEC2335182.1 nucleotidyltransferase domain-containing protein [Bacillus subtilis]